MYYQATVRQQWWKAAVKVGMIWSGKAGGSLEDWMEAGLLGLFSLE